MLSAKSISAAFDQTSTLNEPPATESGSETICGFHGSQSILSILLPVLSKCQVSYWHTVIQVYSQHSIYSHNIRPHVRHGHVINFLYSSVCEGR